MTKSWLYWMNSIGRMIAHEPQFAAKMTPQPGLVLLFGSGETASSGRKIWDWLLRRLPHSPNLAILETPAGFQPNSALVASEIAAFLEHHLRNYAPRATVIPARRRATAFSPDDPAIVAPLCLADAIFLGPGSPTYAVRQLRDSLAWRYLTARHRLGAPIVFASAAALAASAHTLPVYEIYKAGEELHWQPGLDFLQPFGLDLTFIPHWNNQEGGVGLDTSHCFMGQERFAALQTLLPADAAFVGIDEHTALILDLAAGEASVQGQGVVTLIKDQRLDIYPSGASFPLRDLGDYQAIRLPELGEDLPSDLWPSPPAPLPPPPDVLALVEAREIARQQHDWARADALRRQVQARGWQIRDTVAGPDLSPT